MQFKWKYDRVILSEFEVQKINNDSNDFKSQIKLS